MRTTARHIQIAANQLVSVLNKDEADPVEIRLFVLDIIMWAGSLEKQLREMR